MTVTAPLRIADLIAESRRDIDANAPDGKRIAISFDEWNVSHPRAALTGRPYRQNYALADGLYAAGFFNVMLRNADHITMANQAQMVNLLGLIETSQTDCYGTPEYLAFQLYVDHSGSDSLAVEAESPVFDVPQVGNMPARTGVAYLDVAASHAPEQHRLFIHVINRHPSEAANMTVEIKGLTPTGITNLHVLDGPEVWAVNTHADHHVVQITTRTGCPAARTFTAQFPPHSATSLEVACV
jgi:alpha-N-arabinofuranosidase